MSVVVDTSLFTKWFFVESDSTLAVKQLGEWRSAGVALAVPELAQVEFANILLQRLATGEVSIHNAPIFQVELRRFVEIVPPTTALSIRALELAHRMTSRSVYDFYFLALAEELGCDLWTADERFWRVVHLSFPFVRWLGEAVGPAEPGAFV